jgi:hypothetical protein
MVDPTVDETAPPRRDRTAILPDATDPFKHRA